MQLVSVTFPSVGSGSFFCISNRVFFSGYGHAVWVTRDLPVLSYWWQAVIALFIPPEERI